MKTLIVYDSFFGNTEQIAQAMGNSIGTGESVVILRVGEIKPEHLRNLGLLIVGSPTRAFRPTSAISNFLNKFAADSLKGVSVAAFDTRMDIVKVNSRILNIMVKIFGYAAMPIAKKLVKKGGDLLNPPEGFIVQESEGPLKDGELERAVDWVTLALHS